MNTCFSSPIFNAQGFYGAQCAPACPPYCTDCSTTPFNTSPFNSFATPWTTPFNQYTPWNAPISGVNPWSMFGSTINTQSFNPWPISGFRGLPFSGFGAQSWNSPISSFVPSFGTLPYTQNYAQNWNLPFANSTPWSNPTAWNAPINAGASFAPSAFPTITPWSQLPTGLFNWNTIPANQFGWNQFGINQLGMNQLGINQYGMNQYGFGSTGMNQPAISPFAINPLWSNLSTWNLPFAAPFNATVPSANTGVQNAFPYASMPFAGVPFYGYGVPASTIPGQTVKGKKGETETVHNAVPFAYPYAFGGFPFFMPAAYCAPCNNDTARAAA